MKLFFFLAALILAAPAQAAEKTLRLDDGSVNFEAGLGHQVTLVFSQALRSQYFPDAAYPKMTLSDLPDGKVCFYSVEAGIEPGNDKFKALARTEQSDLCVARTDASVRYEAQDVAGAPPQPFFQTDADNCKWSWKTGTGIGLWAEDCKFEGGSYLMTYDQGKDSFVVGAEGSDAYEVVRQFHKKADEGPDALLPGFKAKGLIPNDDECKFEKSDVAKGFGDWTIYEIKPSGKRKADYEAVPSGELPDPPCGDLGLAVDYLGYFMISAAHPDRVIYLDLGQDTPMFDPTSITLF